MDKPPITISLNSKACFHLTTAGVEYLKRTDGDWPELQPDGSWTMMLWDFMHRFGPAMGMTQEPVVEKMTLTIIPLSVSHPAVGKTTARKARGTKRGPKP